MEGIAVACKGSDIPHKPLTLDMLEEALEILNEGKYIVRKQKC